MSKEKTTPNLKNPNPIMIDTGFYNNYNSVKLNNLTIPNLTFKNKISFLK
jgi:hypothetical protein